MVVENEIASFSEWLLGGQNLLDGALVQFGLTVGALAMLALVVGFVVLLVRYGPSKAGEVTYQTISSGVGELLRISPRRVSALAGLAVKESLRRRVLVGLALFVLILLFASWFLPASDHADPIKLYFSFVLTAMSFLALLLALLLSTFSLPNEFKTKTIYTIVTKPVRAGDIVLGRIVGFTIIGTFMLAVMGLCSYVFVLRSLDHTHPVSLVDNPTMEEVLNDEGQVTGLRGSTGLGQRHSHAIEADADGQGFALMHRGHEHTIDPGASETSSATNLMRARSPLRGTIRFIDSNGVRKAKGVSVGNEWTYRSFIPGGTQAAAIWTFSGIDKSTLSQNGSVLPIELNVRVFRTHKGDIEREIQGSIQLRNPQAKMVSGVKTYVTNNLQTFGAKDDSIDAFDFPVEQFDADLKPINLLDDLVSDDGRIEVIVQSLERGQYYGFAQADCYIRLRDDWPLWNFIKGNLSIWVQMVIVITIGVTASTFLNGPIAMLFTTSFVLLGFFRDFLIGIATGVQPNGEKVYGGGPVEAFVRLVTQKNLTTKFDESLGTSIMQGTDNVLAAGIQAVTYILPDFSTLSSVNYVAEGFSIPPGVIGRELAIALAYVVGLSVAGYFFLKTREIAK